MSLSTPWAFQDTSTECAICLEPLDGVDYNDDDHPSNKRATITLSCGHRWHLECLKEQLELARPNSTKRLLFSGCQCAKCGTICEHKALEDYTRTTDALRLKVNDLLMEHLNNDVASLSSNNDENKRETNISANNSLLLAWKQVQYSKDPQVKEKVLHDARKKYAFYLCSHCQEPYFGGTVECSDGMVEEDDSIAEPRLCMACTPQIVCRNPVEHLASIVWKCRYCCQPATHVCYGNVHFCHSCHDRNTQRVEQLHLWKQEQRYARRSGQDSTILPPAPLESIPCPGNDCPFPKPPLSSFSGTNNDNNNPTFVAVSNSSSSATAEYHTNGSAPDCEQVYTCLICQSAVEEQQEAQGSENLLINPSGQLGLQGWQQLNRRMSWQVEDSGWPLNRETTTNFVSSFETCVMSQVVDLGRLIPSVEATRFQTDDFSVEVSARYQARTDCPSVFRLEAIAMDRNRRTLERLQTSVLDAPPDHWGKAKLILEHLRLEQASHVAIVITGKDRPFWNGNFGSKVADCSVRILWDRDRGNREEYDNDNGDGDVPGPNNENEALVQNREPAPNGGHNALRLNRRVHQVHVGPAHQEGRRNWLLLDLILPVVCFVLFAWLAK